MNDIEAASAGSSKQFDTLNPFSRTKAPKRQTPSSNERLPKCSKPDRVTISSDHLNSSETKLLESALSAFLLCSTCNEKKDSLKQCCEGHLLCLDCLKGCVVYCRKCDQFFAVKDLSTCYIATVLSAQKTDDCDLCGTRFKGESKETHCRDSCSQRNVICEYSIYGCVWSGTQEKSVKHNEGCPLKDVRVKEALELLNDKSKYQRALDDTDMMTYTRLYSLVSQQHNGYRIVIESIILYKINVDVINPRMKVMKFRSISANGFYLEIVVKIDLQSSCSKILYSFCSENETKISMFYSMVGCSVDTKGKINNFRDSFHYDCGSKYHEINVYEDNIGEILNRLVLSPLITVDLCILTNESKDDISNRSNKVTTDVVENLFSLMMSNGVLGL